MAVGDQLFGDLLTHDGSSAVARHVANAVLKEDSHGARLAKEHEGLQENVPDKG